MMKFSDLESQSTPVRTKQAKAVALQQMCQVFFIYKLPETIRFIFIKIL